MAHKSWRARALRKQQPAPATIRKIQTVRHNIEADRQQERQRQIVIIERLHEQRPGDVWEYRAMKTTGGAA